MTIRRTRIAALAAVAVLTATAGQAAAADYHVTDAAGLTSAFAAAAASPDADRVIMAAGTYPAGGNGFTYLGGSPLEIIGAGETLTHIVATAATGSGDKSTMRFGSGELKMSGVHVTVPDFQLTRYGIWADRGGIFDHIAISADPATSPNANGLFTQDTTQVTASTFTGTSRAILLSDGVGSAVGDTTITGSATGQGIYAEGKNTSVIIARTKISGGADMILAVGGATVTATDSLLMPDLGAAISASGFAASGATVTTFTGDRLTIASSGGATGLVASATVAGDSVDILLRNSVLTGFAKPVSCTEVAGSASVVTDHMNGPVAGSDVSCGTVLHASRTQHDPGFVDAAAGDYRLRHDSALVDAGRPTSVPEPGALTFDRLTRLVDGDGNGTATVDIGAFEYQHAAPTVTVAASATTAPVGTAFTFTAHAGDVDPLETAALTYAWSFGDGTTATGPQVTHSWAGTGPRTATVTVTDPTAQTATATANVTLTSPPTGTPADTTAPGLRILRAPSRVRIGTALPKVVAASAGQIRFNLTERATLTLTVQRKVGATWRATRTVRLAAPAGTSGLRFTGRITKALTLKPGTYRIKVTAVDEGGNRSAARTTRPFSLTR